jgi:uncharacterized protein YjbI with pentapeptide repeats
MAIPEHLKQLKKGVESWNAWRKENPDFKPGFSDADFQEIDLQGANLNEANFQRANLSRANLQNAILIKANLEATTTSGTKFGGSDTTNATFPKEFNFEKDLEIFDEASKIARKHFGWLIAGLAFSLLTIFSTDDVALLTNSPTTPLPIIQTPIPLAGFYWVAPFLLVFLFFYFHLQLQHNWRIVSRLPAIFPDGVPIDQKLFPWQLNMWCRNFFPVLNPDKNLKAKWQDFPIVFFIYWTTPTVLLGFWFRYLPCHDWWTWFHIILYMATSIFSFWCYLWAKMIFPAKLQLEKVDYVTLAIIVVCNLSIIISMLPKFEKRDFRNANFYQKNVSFKPESWIPENPTQGVKGANLRDANLSFAFGPEAFLAKANLQRANLKNSNFKKADFKEGNLFMVNFNETILIEAELQNTNLRRAKFIGAYLQDANLSNANLSESNLFDAKLKMANLSKANLKNANLTDVDLTLVKNLTCIQLQSAYINTKTKIPDYLKISKGTMYKKFFQNWEIEALKDYQCEEIRSPEQEKQKR